MLVPIVRNTTAKLGSSAQQRTPHIREGGTVALAASRPIGSSLRLSGPELSMQRSTSFERHSSAEARPPALVLGRAHCPSGPHGHDSSHSKAPLKSSQQAPVSYLIPQAAHQRWRWRRPPLAHSPGPAPARPRLRHLCRPGAFPDHQAPPIVGGVGGHGRRAILVSCRCHPVVTRKGPRQKAGGT
jgi:hypothetical protein